MIHILVLLLLESPKGLTSLAMITNAMSEQLVSGCGGSGMMKNTMDWRSGTGCPKLVTGGPEGGDKSSDDNKGDECGGE